MKPTKDVECEYLAKDHRSCTSVDEVTGQAGRDKGCSADSKDLCCYLCEKKGTCDISCSFLDEPEEKENVQEPQMRSASSVDGSESVFLCPFCGAPYRKLIPAGTVNVRCDYCGADILVPSQLGGKVQRCPNHPDNVVAGVCNECGESFCDSCLFAVRGGQQYLCPVCYKDYKSGTRSVLLAFAVILPMFLLIISLIVWANPGAASTSPVQFFLLMVAGVILFVGLVAGARWFSKQDPVTLHDIRIEEASERKMELDKERPS